MRTSLVALLVVVAVVAADVHELKNPIKILKQEWDYNLDGSYKYYFDTENGIHQEAVGEIKKVGEDTIQTVQGSYSYTAPDGTPVLINYVADETGYHPEGDLIPTPPPIPEAIQRALEYIRTHPPKEDQQ